MVVEVRARRIAHPSVDNYGSGRSIDDAELAALIAMGYEPTEGDEGQMRQALGGNLVKTPDGRFYALYFDAPSESAQLLPESLVRAMRDTEQSIW